MSEKHSGWSRTYSGERVSRGSRTKSHDGIRERTPSGYSSDDFKRLFEMQDNGQTIEAFLATMPPPASNE